MAGVPHRPQRPAARRTLLDAILEFRPWMLALAVFLACAIGIAIMERSRDDGQMWAHAVPDDVTQRR